MTWDYQAEHVLALVGNSVSTDLARERVTALHRAFGHTGKESLRAIIKQHNFRGIQEHHLQLLQPCNACMLGKSHRASKNKLAAEKATKFGYRLAADCCGPFRNLSVSGAKYLLVIIDEFTSWTWVVPGSPSREIVPVTAGSRVILFLKLFKQKQVL